VEFEPIKIKIKDKKRFAEVAFAIDSPIFIKEANILRKRFGIKEPLKKDNHESWVIKNIIEVEGLGEKTANELFESIRRIREYLYLDFNFQPIFEKAVFGCDILSGDYDTTPLIDLYQLTKHQGSCPRSYRYILDSNLSAIVITPQTTFQTVENAYNKYVKLQQIYNEDPETFCFYRCWDSRFYIKRDRKFFWEKEKWKKSYLTIAKEAEKRYRDPIPPEDYKGTVRQAIIAYKEALLLRHSLRPKVAS